MGRAAASHCPVGPIKQLTLCMQRAVLEGHPLGGALCMCDVPGRLSASIWKWCSPLRFGLVLIVETPDLFRHRPHAVVRSRGLGQVQGLVCCSCTPVWVCKWQQSNACLLGEKVSLNSVRFSFECACAGTTWASFHSMSFRQSVIG